jgi:hypothetical protein
MKMRSEGLGMRAIARLVSVKSLMIAAIIAASPKFADS